MKNNSTKREHFIPQVYLNGFASPDKRVLFYDLNKNLYSKTMVPVRTICFQENLYEYKNKENEIISTNTIEKALSVLESQFAQNKRAIKTRINVINSHTTSFLSEAEVNFWLIYITVQILRMPLVIEEITKAIHEIVHDSGDENLYRNTALFLLLPFLRKLEPDSIELKLFNEVISSISNLRCSLAYDYQGRLFTSDKSLYLYSPTKRFSDSESIIFPIDSSVCLWFTKREFPHNSVISIDDDKYERICKSIAYSAYERLFSQRRFTKQEIKWIRSAREDKRKDEQHNRSGHLL